MKTFKTLDEYKNFLNDFLEWGRITENTRFLKSDYIYLNSAPWTTKNPEFHHILVWYEERRHRVNIIQWNEELEIVLKHWAFYENDHSFGSYFCNSILLEE